ncbi:MAG: chemotaxis protein CheA [Nevskia sp.]|jgi:two-component system chemotaxis sensor kinase CheA|nr:chemotaxis protein CheA [Nevskia sp.]
MSSAVDDDIRADFLVEAGELMQKLGEQLVELEQRPDDRELLNSVFRAFHTVKGGAGFLQIAPMVELCHAAEEVFGVVRSGARAVDADLMDATMQSVDQLQTMLDQIGAGNEATSAPPELIVALRQGAQGPAEAKAAAPAPEAAKPKAKAKSKAKSKAAAEKAPTAAQSNTITDDEFEALLDQLNGGGPPGIAAPAAAAAPAQSNTITDDEFEALLDQLNGGGPPGVDTSAATPPAAPKAAPAQVTPHKVPAAAAPAAASAAPAAETTLRVDTQRLDLMMNLIGELVLVRNRLKTLRGSGAPPEAYAKSVGELDHITRSLQSAVMRIRMQPIKKVFSRFPKLARDVARGLGKQVEVELIGEDTDLDKNLVEALADPLVHMVRNSVDHGIETPEARAAAGKPAAGKLVLSAQQEGDHILITVRDDGKGMDSEVLRRKVVEKGLMEAGVAARLTTDECLQLVFMAGFSTKDAVSDLSGRGVGMDVVKSRITGLNGSVVIESKVGQGSCVRLRVPLTLAILPALMVTVGERLLALPLADVFDVFALDESRLRKLDLWHAVVYRKSTLRLIDLERWSGARPPSGDAPRHVVVAEANGERYGFIVHQVKAREEVVIKPLGMGLRGLAGLAGATVTGEGRVALILDFPGLVRAYGAGLKS